MVRWSRGLGAVLTGEAGVAGWAAAAALPCCCCADGACAWDWDVAGCGFEFTPFVVGCVVGGLEPCWVCDWVLLAVWELEPPGEEAGAPLV